MLFHATFHGNTAILSPAGGSPETTHLAPRITSLKPATFNQQPAPQLPRIIRLISLFAKPTDRGAGDTINRWITARFKNGKHGPKNGKFLSRIATGCACASRAEVLNRTYPFPRMTSRIQPNPT